MSFGERLKAARKSAGLSQAELAGNRCSVSYVSHLESGRRTPTPEIIRHFETTLGLEVGSLGGVSDFSGASRRKAGEAEAVALYSEAVLAWRQGAFGLALEQVQEARSQVPHAHRSDLALLLAALAVEVQIDLGRYEDALSEARSYLEAARAAGSPLLEARALILASKAARVRGDLDAARSWAAEAVRVCEPGDLSVSVKVPALIAAISAGHGDAARYVEQLEASVVGLDDETHARGLAEWVLGTMWLRAGDVEASIAAHERANRCLSPTADFRNWARFPRAVAEERLDAGSDQGVAELLDEAGRRIELLNSADEMAALALVRARLACSRKHEDEALAEVAAALGEGDVPAATQARLYLLAARIHGQRGDGERSTAMALRSARLFTEAGNVAQARSAWELVDRLGPDAE